MCSVCIYLYIHTSLSRRFILYISWDLGLCSEGNLVIWLSHLIHTTNLIEQKLRTTLSLSLSLSLSLPACMADQQTIFQLKTKDLYPFLEPRSISIIANCFYTGSVLWPSALFSGFSWTCLDMRTISRVNCKTHIWGEKQKKKHGK